MNYFTPALLTVIGLLLVFVIWWIWTQRNAAREQARREAELAKLAKTMQAISHDLGNLLQIMTANLQSAPRTPDAELMQIVEEVEKAAVSATKLVEAVRGRQSAAPTHGTRSAEAAVRLATALLRHDNVPIQLVVTGDFDHHGTHEDALRIVQNLLINAARECKHLPNARVDVTLDGAALRISNPVRDPALLDDQIWESGTSHAESSGLGLPIVRETANRIGWSVRHLVEGDRVTFLVEANGPTTYRG
jgi:signal transduction histidine kinase